MARVKVGDRFGRWTVVRLSGPGRIGNESHTRARCTVCCRCGVEKTLFEVDLKRGRSTGCRSAVCKAEWRAEEAVRIKLAGLLSEAGGEPQGAS